MPYYMPFYTSDYGFHGSPNVPGKHASHGCVRMFTSDAKWMNRNFAEKGTRVIIRPYPDQKQATLSKK
jgi:lipoprotein-anchoring transpeptidase ErfK/SrfK